jgi:hypothetical protein
VFFTRIAMEIQALAGSALFFGILFPLGQWYAPFFGVGDKLYPHENTRR